MLTPALMLRAARHDLSRGTDGRWVRDTGKTLVVWPSERGRYWSGPETIADALLCADELSALSLALDWLDTQHPEKVPTAANLAQLSLSETVQVLCDSVEQDGLTEAAERAMGAALHANPDAAVRVADSVKVARPWVQDGRWSRRYAANDPKECLAHVEPRGSGYLWILTPLLGQLTPAGTLQEAQAAADAALQERRFALAGGPVLLETPAPAEAQPEGPLFDESWTGDAYHVRCRQPITLDTLSRAIRRFTIATGRHPPRLWAHVADLRDYARAEGQLNLDIRDEATLLGMRISLAPDAGQWVVGGAPEGAAARRDCPTCNGSGEWVSPYSRYGIGSRCPDCAGSGRAPAVGAP